jgi:hypothetical protein
VLFVPKRLRYFMQRDGATLNMVLRIFLRVIAQSLQAHSPGAGRMDKVTLHIGAVAFIHRFGSSLNEHLHFHVCVVDGVFECARPPFAMDRLREEGSALVYLCAKQHSEPGADKRGARVDQLTLTPLELIAAITALEPPPRTHRHRYFGVLAPNSPLRARVTAKAVPAQAMPAQPAQTGANERINW